jgi:ASPIC and UnbV
VTREHRFINGPRDGLQELELPLTFGLGQLNHADELTITWTSGKVTTLKNLKADRSCRIDENAGMKPKSRSYDANCAHRRNVKSGKNPLTSIALRFRAVSVT